MNRFNAGSEPRLMTSFRSVSSTSVRRRQHAIGPRFCNNALPHYRQGTRLTDVCHAVAEHLVASAAGAASWSDVLDAYEGMNTVPVMTIHKSKGLEFHTVLCVGLDDRAWWSYGNDTRESTAGFFVAFTRAKQRVVFSYCEARGGRTEIAAFYDLLRDAGVEAHSPI